MRAHSFNSPCSALLRLVLSGCLAWLAGCGSSQQARNLPAQTALARQLKATCAGEGSYEKTVRSPEAQTQVFAYADTCLLPSELDKLFEICWQDPKLADALLLSHTGDTLVITPNAGKGSGLALVRQEVVIFGDTLRYARTRMRTKNWLYEQETDVWVRFGPDGRYQRHEMRVLARQPWRNASFSALISGRQL